MRWKLLGILENGQMTGVAKSPNDVMMGRTWTRSRIWMMRPATAMVMPAAKTTSMSMRRGTKTPAGRGARPKTMNRMVSGIHEINVLSAFTHMVSRGKHSRGNCVLASRALLLSSD